MNRLPSISTLMSPPEAKPYESFSPTVGTSKSPPAAERSTFNSDLTLPPISNCLSQPQTLPEVLPSPPISPWPNHDHRREDESGKVAKMAKADVTVQDPPLYPSSEADIEIAADEPLFPPEHVSSNEDALITKHMASHMFQFRESVNQPTREEYLLALACVPIVSRGYNRNPGAWLKRERDILDERFSQAKRVRKVSATAPSRVLATLAPAPSRSNKKKVPSPQAIRAPRMKRSTPKTTPRGKALDSFDIGSGTSPKVRVIGANRDDSDYRSLPDYCPPTSTLPKNNPRALKAEWAGKLLDLSHDPDIHMLHEAEVHLASTLRLSGATYLCSKRRIFDARLNALRIGKEFRKTDAQQACKIDVNKASKLWTAYERVGWFKRELFEQHLR
ncbi:hypothetical protein MMC16_006677 [Acarospora aff. strigata]|nr:hypothetical protein [Acarospora aff. strigata]